MRKILSIFLCFAMLIGYIPAGVAMADEEPAGSNADLSSLTVAGSVYYDLTPAFNAGTTAYAVDVPNDVSSVEITATTADTAATLEINGTAATSGSAQTVDNLAVGDNPVAVAVTAQDGTTVKTYTMTIKRAGAGELPQNLVKRAGVSELPQTPAAYAAGDYAKYAAKMAAGGDHVAVVRPNGTVAAWGDNKYGQCDVPAGLTDVQAVAAGASFTMALTGDGKVHCWGSNTIGDVVTPITIPQEVTNVQGKIKQIAAGGIRLAVVTQDNNVIEWRSNKSAEPVMTGDMGNIVAVAVNSSASAVLNDTGTISAWGTSGTTGLADINDGKAVAIAAGQFNFLALKKDGTVTGWGSSSHVSSSNNISTYSNNNKNVRAIAGGMFFAAALLADGSVRSWGNSSPASGNTDQGNELMAASANVKAISAAPVRGELSGADTCILQGDGTVAVMGPNNCGQTQTPAGLNLLTQPSGSDAGLSSLEVAGYSLSPVFDASTTAYTVNVSNDVNSVSITATASDSNAILKSGALAAWSTCSRTVDNLAEGDNSVAIEVTAADGTTVKTYTITVKRGGASQSNNADLSGLTVAGYELAPAFAAVTAEYSVNVANDVSSVEITATTADSNATLKINGTVASSGTAQTVGNLAEGDNPVTVAVTAPDGTTVKTYTITVKRAVASQDKNADLSGLAVAGYDLNPAFAAGTTAYTVKIPNVVIGVNITATTADSSATLKINGTVASSGTAQAVDNLAVGDNPVTVEVTAPDGTTAQTYTLTIKRAENSGLPTPAEEYAASDYARLADRLAAGQWHAAAVLADGTVEVWGDNSRHQLEVTAEITGVKALAAGSGYTLALKNDGTVTAWGSVNGQYAKLNGTTVKAVDAWWNSSAALTDDNRVVVWGGYGERVVQSDKNLVDIAINSSYLLALAADGTVEAWEWRRYQDGVFLNDCLPCAVPDGFSENVVAITAGENHALALKEDGSVVCWGNDEYPVPAGLADVRAVVAGSRYSAALTADGGVTVWGALNYSPSGLTQVRALTAGISTMYALLEDGTVVSWGGNSKGERNVPEDLNLNNPVSTNDRLVGLSVETGDGAVCSIYPEFSCVQSEGTIDIAYDTNEVLITAQPYSSAATLWINGSPATSGSTVAINGAGLVVGDNPVEIKVIAESGSERTYTLHIKKDGADYTLPQIPAAYQAGELAAYARKLAVGYQHSLVLKKDGTVAAWGSSNLYGECGVPYGLNNVAAMAAGDRHSLVLKIDGTVVAWGDNEYGQCDVPAGLGEVADISAGRYFSAALDKNGEVVAWGDNSEGQCDVPVGLNDVADIQCGFAFMLALKADGTVVAWGDNRCGQCDVPAGLSGVVAVAAGGKHGVALKADGTLAVWGQQQEYPGLQYVKAITAGQDFTAALKYDGSVVAWGNNIDMGISLKLDREVLAVSGSSCGGQLLALSRDGTVAVWGGNTQGYCGVLQEGLNLLEDDAPPYSGPAPNIPQTPAEYAASDYVQAAARVCSVMSGVAVLNMDGTVMVKSTLRGEQKNDVDVVPEGLSNVKAIATSFFNVMALKEDGTVVVWGYNGDGQCQVPEGVKDVIAIAANNWNTYCLALKSDGTVTAWGGNYAGQCDVPAGLSKVTAIAASVTHCLALKADGTVAAWGNNGDGQCDVPPGLSGVARVFAYDGFSLALKNDGTVVAWGDNKKGQCDVPEGLSGVVDINISEHRCIALKSNGTVVVWGNNCYGCRNVPVGLHDVVAVGSGGTHRAIKADGSVESWGNAPSFVDASQAGLSNVLTISGGVAIFRDGTLKYYSRGSKADEINAQLIGLNVFSGHYFAVDKAELLNPADGRAITTVGSQGGYRVQARVANNTPTPTPGLAIIQVRGGSGATGTGGGRVLGCVGLSGQIPVSGSTVSSDFTMPSGISGPAYVDVFVWDGWDTMVPRAKARQDLSFSVME